MNANIILFLVCFCGLPYAPKVYDVKKIGIENGLSNNNTISFAQDKDGFIWIATKDGLNRFDASSFKIFKSSETNSNSLSSNLLNCVYADKFDDVVWIATEKNGIDAYNYKTHTFTHYEQDNSGTDKNSLIANGVTHIADDAKGNLWLATYLGGIDYFDKKTGKFTHYNQSNVMGLGSDYNWCVMYDTEETIYAGHVKSGFSIIDTKLRRAVNFIHDPLNPESLPDNTVCCIFKDSKKNIWIGTRNGLTLFDPKTYKMTNFKKDPKNPSSISHNFIQSINESNDFKLWIGTEGGGVNILDLTQLSDEVNPSKINFDHIPIADTPDGLSSASVQDILIDSFGNVWIGGFAAGINFIPNRAPHFNKISYMPLIGIKNSLNNKIVVDICTDYDNNIWIANTSGGISIFNKNEKIKQISRINNYPKPLNVTSIYRGSENIWIGLVDGTIYKYNLSTGRYTPFTVFNNIKNIPIIKFFEDSKQNIWICTDIGLGRYNIQTGSHSFYNTLNTALKDDNIRAVAEDDKGNIWVGTLGGGLGIFDQEFKLLYNYGNYFDFYAVTQIYKDSNGRMWIGSQNDLFLFKNYNNDDVIRIGKSSGLAENYIRAIAEGESADEIWLSTTNGISHIDLNTMHVSNFTISDGITLGDFEKGSVTKTAGGTIYFGSQNGITFFNQVLEQNNNLIPKFSFTNFFVTNYENNLNEFINIPFADSMELKYNQNSFQIYFNVLDYSMSQNVEFVFQMKGLDDGWYLINKEKHVTFRNLKPGNYIFNIKTRLRNAEWSDDIKSMYIRIEPPFWLTWWAKFIYFTLIVLIIVYIFRFYKNKFKIKNDLLLEKKGRQQEQMFNEERIKFFTNVTHELRTPMTLILGPLEDLISEASFPPKYSKKLNSIYLVANRLLQLINQILEFRKSESKNRKLRVLKDDLVNYVFNIGEKYKELNQNKDIELQIALPEKKIELFFDPEIITIILDNLISNAFKYTKKGIISV